MKFNKGEIPFLYIFIYSKLKEHSKNQRYVRPKFIKEWILRICPKVPKTLLFPIMCQLEEYNLIKREHKMIYQVLNSNCDKILNELRNFTFW